MKPQQDNPKFWKAMIWMGVISGILSLLLFTPLLIKCIVEEKGTWLIVGNSVFLALGIWSIINSVIRALKYVAK